jgi:hypothetical protein
LTLVVDTGPLVSLADASDPRRQATLDVLSNEPFRAVSPLHGGTFTILPADG